jgi:hypothetical protein
MLLYRDSRKERATELLNSFANREFWAAFSNQPKRMAKAAKEGEVGVMPAPRDVKIWFVFLFPRCFLFSIFRLFFPFYFFEFSQPDVARLLA